MKSRWLLLLYGLGIDSSSTTATVNIGIASSCYDGWRYTKAQ
jgi:hypothetical protein